MKKRKWVKPVLVVLTRWTQGEAILSGCKQDGSPEGTSPKLGASSCWGWGGCDLTCESTGGGS